MVVEADDALVASLTMLPMPALIPTATALQFTVPEKPIPVTNLQRGELLLAMMRMSEAATLKGKMHLFPVVDWYRGIDAYDPNDSYSEEHRQLQYGAETYDM